MTLKVSTATGTYRL